MTTATKPKPRSTRGKPAKTVDTIPQSFREIGLKGPKR